MKLQNILPAVLLMMGSTAQAQTAITVNGQVVGAFAQSSAQDFVIKGNIKGIKNGTKVALRSKESGKYIEAECLSQGNSFVLKGKVEGTLLVQLCIDDKPKAEYKE